MMDPLIHDRGRGPEIVGSRITVYDVLDYASTRTPEFIAELFKLRVEQIHAALVYIEEHREEVMVEYRKMLARDAAGNSPEIQAKVDEGHRLFLLLEEVRQLSPAKWREIMDVRRSSYPKFKELLQSTHAALTRGTARATTSG